MIIIDLQDLNKNIYRINLIDLNYNTKLLLVILLPFYNLKEGLSNKLVYFIMTEDILEDLMLSKHPIFYSNLTLAFLLIFCLKQDLQA
jgi:hypothetical protein